MKYVVFFLFFKKTILLFWYIIILMHVKGIQLAIKSIKFLFFIEIIALSISKFKKKEEEETFKILKTGQGKTNWSWNNTAEMSKDNTTKKTNA